MSDGFKLLTRPDRNPKVAKGAAAGFWTAILHLAPADLAGRGTVCPWSTAGCRAACLNKAGRGGIVKTGERTNAIQRARVARTRRFFDDRAGFLADLDRDIAKHVRKAAAAGFKPAVRLNGTSDIAWERVVDRDFFTRWAGVVFYDYTKSTARVLQSLAMRAWRERCRAPDFPAQVVGQTVPAYWPENYALTLSWSGSNAQDCADVLRAGGNVAVAFKGGPVPVGAALDFGGTPVVFYGSNPGPGEYPIVDGDATDLRFMDPPGAVVGLKAKGPAKRDRTGFVLALK